MIPAPPPSPIPAPAQPAVPLAFFQLAAQHAALQPVCSVQHVIYMYLK